MLLFATQLELLESSLSSTSSKAAKSAKILTKTYLIFLKYYLHLVQNILFLFCFRDRKHNRKGLCKLSLIFHFVPYPLVRFCARGLFLSRTNTKTNQYIVFFFLLALLSQNCYYSYICIRGYLLWY